MKTPNLNKYGLEFAGRRLTKRRLGIWLWLVVAAIVLALVGAARAETLRGGEKETLRRGDLESPSLMVSESPRLAAAGLGASDAVAVVVVLFVIVGLVVRLAWGWCVEADERSTYEEETWGDDLLSTLPPSPTLTPTPAPALALARSEGGGVGDGGGGGLVETMPEGLTRVDAAMIVHACASRVGLIRSIVQGAQRPSTDEDQEEALATAERLLGDLRVTLFELRAKFQGKDAPRSLEGRGDEGTGLTGVTSTGEGAV